MERTTIEVLGNMLKAASDDETRYRLTAVLIQKMNYGKQAVLEAHVTDGHIACKRIINDGSLLEALKTGDKVLFFPDAVKSLKNMCGKGQVLHVSRESDTVIEFSLGGQSVKVPINDQESKTYPVGQIKGFYSTQRESPIRVLFNPELLQALLVAMREDKRQVGVTLEFDAADLDKAISVQVNGCEGGFNGVIMPLRGDDVNKEVNKATLAKMGEVK